MGLRVGVVPFFINPSQPPTSRLFYIVPRFQRLIFPHCVQHVSSSLNSPQFHLTPIYLHSFLFLCSVHCHWQTNLNGSIKSIRSNGTCHLYILIYTEFHSICNFSPKNHMHTIQIKPSSLIYPSYQSIAN